MCNFCLIDYNGIICSVSNIDERQHSISYLAEKASLDCDTTCSGETGLVEWNTHLLSKNYNITISCQNDSCTSKNEETKLLNLEQDFTMDNNTLHILPHRLYQSSLIGCIATADNCTAYGYWYISYGMFSDSYFVCY